MITRRRRCCSSWQYRHSKVKERIIISYRASSKALRYIQEATLRRAPAKTGNGAPSPRTKGSVTSLNSKWYGRRVAQQLLMRNCLESRCWSWVRNIHMKATTYTPCMMTIIELLALNGSRTFSIYQCQISARGIIKAEPTWPILVLSDIIRQTQRSRLPFWLRLS